MRRRMWCAEIRLFNQENPMSIRALGSGQGSVVAILVSFAIGCANSDPSIDVSSVVQPLVSTNEINTSGGPFWVPATPVLQYGVPSGDNQPANVFPARMLTMTFDDGPDAYTKDLAAYLRDQNIRATFFVRTCRLQTASGQDQHNWRAGICDTQCTSPGVCPEFPRSWLQDIANMGHRIANHTKSHVPLANQTASDIVDEVLSAHSILSGYVTDGIFAFRAPYHSYSPAVANAINSDPTLQSLLIGSIGEEVDGLDWQCVQQGLTPQACSDLYIQSLIAMPRMNGVVQIHDGNEFSVGTDYALQLTKAFVNTIRTDPHYQNVRFVPLDAVPGVTGTRSFAASNTASSTDFSDAGQWATNPSYYGSIRLADVGGDAKADVCGRGISGIACAIAGANGFGAATLWSTGSQYSDTDGWLPDKYGKTIMFGNVNGLGKADVCGRGSDGIYCAMSDGTGHFTNRTRWTAEFSDSAGWGGNESYYGSIRLADVNGDGKADVCGRGPGGIRCALSNGSTFNPSTLWSSDFSDAGNWLPAEYGTTIQFGDIDGNGRADVCGRGTLGIYCALAPSTGSGFGAATLWSQWGAFSNADGWNTSASRYRSIKLGRVDSDSRADICGRTETGLVCAYSDAATSTFTRYVHVKNDYFTDSLGWSPLQYGSTVQMGDITGDGHADLCGRGGGGIYCARAP
jgi:peptidoglycan/xylan/chitin deacetylase (PgdA/CDA1 family)